MLSSVVPVSVASPKDQQLNQRLPSMSPLFLLPYLLYFVYQGYIALQKRAAARQKASLFRDTEKRAAPLASGTKDALAVGPSSVNVGTTALTRVRNLHVAQANPRPTANDPSFDDRDDYADADRGFIAALEPGVIKTADGKGIAWDVDKFGFLKKDAEALPTIHPNLVRQGQLSIKQGLYEVAIGVYQVRALDVSNMTILEGEKGVVVIDPLVSVECARAAIELYYAHRGRRPLTGLIFSHSHADHFMGGAGVVDEPFDPASIPIIAPEGFLVAAIKENVLVGPAMLKRGISMFGQALPTNPRGLVGVGLGLGASGGAKSLHIPNRLIRETGEEHVVDGVHIVFQMVPDTEAPAEVNFFFPATNVLLISETATNCMHNITTLRGAQVRDAKAWSLYLDEAIGLFGSKTDVLIGSHNWPMWGRQRIQKRLATQRDLYGYLHDQTVRHMNLGKTGAEIAETLTLPPAVSRAWYCRGFYGSLNHNVKGIYQRYLTWFDGRAAHLWQYPPKEEGQRYVDVLGGLAVLNDKAEACIANGDSRFAVTLLAHAVAAAGGPAAVRADKTETIDEKEKGNSVLKNPAYVRTKQLLIVAYENLGFGSENATWRNFFLTAALELRTGRDFRDIVPSRASLAGNLPVSQWLDILSVQIHSERATSLTTSTTSSLAIDIEVVDEMRAEWRLIVSNGVLTKRHLTPAVREAQVLAAKTGNATEEVQLSLVLTRAQLLANLNGASPVQAIKYTGDLGALQTLLDLVAA
ncbi:hypothetical protein SBRCBS47491_001407 [Sporothrix bragantina]|uniref:Metallo-beta-lactamase domain-containing protein n=1 Tax=Sporothrix bragantina TaxID=671064 RepID=A0ABP0AYD2_9PEZI